MKMNGILQEIPTGTSVDFTMTLSIVGKLAQFGSRLINDVTDQVLNQFIANFKAKLVADTDYVAATNPTATAESMVDAVPAPIQKKTEKEATTAEKAQALSDSAKAVQKALADVQKAQAALDDNLVESLATAGAVATNGVEAAKKEIPKAEPTASNTDNSLNGFSLMWMVIKGWFSRLFGGGK